jgi:hypothetical protein
MAEAEGGRLEGFFPGLKSTPYRVTSPASPLYNCISWAAGDAARWWEPDPDGVYYWPTGAPREDSIESYTAAFLACGFETCDSPISEPGFEKVALFADAAGPTHAARQLADGSWTSKLGLLQDISHELEALEGQEYGTVIRIMKRRVAEG